MKKAFAWLLGLSSLIGQVSSSTEANFFNSDRVEFIFKFKVEGIYRSSFVSVPKDVSTITNIFTILHGMGMLSSCSTILRHLEHSPALVNAIVLCPIGTQYAATTRVWNAGTCCLSRHNDSLFISSLIRHFTHFTQEHINGISYAIRNSFDCFLEKETDNIYSSFPMSQFQFDTKYEEANTAIKNCRRKSIGRSLTDEGMLLRLGDYPPNMHSFLVGYSNGAMMAQRMTCEYADHFTAVSSVAGQLALEKCQEKAMITHLAYGYRRPLGLQLINFSQDSIVKYNGRNLYIVKFQSMKLSRENWIDVMGLAEKGRIEEGDVDVHTIVTTKVNVKKEIWERYVNRVIVPVLRIDIWDRIDHGMFTDTDATASLVDSGVYKEAREFFEKWLTVPLKKENRSRIFDTI